MNEGRYNAICKACDQLLTSSDSSNERVAIPWLHMIRPHPLFLENYQGLFASHAPAIGERFIRNAAAALYRIARAVISGGPLWWSVGELQQKCDVLIISHIVNDSCPRTEGDFYYSPAPSELMKHGLRVTIGLINHTEVASSVLAKKWRKAKIPRVVFTTSLGVSTELTLFRRGLAEARRLKSFANKQTDQLSRRVSLRASAEAISGGALFSLRLGQQIRALVVRLQPQAIIVTYEGHSWERIAFAAARAVSPQIRCIGYQHAALFNLQHALQTRLAEGYNPDVVLTAGCIAKTQLQKNPQLRDVRIEALGSNRSFERKPARRWKASHGDALTCLVLPEGLVSECNLLFGFALHCARRMPNVRFIWRLHPSLTFEELIRKNPNLHALPTNVTVSTLHTLPEDISRSHWALYRSSTAIVQATVAGILPIYLHQNGEMQIDTLYQIADLRPQVIEVDDFCALVTNADDEDFDARAEQVQDFCERLFTPLDIEVLVSCLETVS